MESIFTSPDMIYMQQEDPANVVVVNGEESDAIDVNDQRFMFFIRNGQFSVNIKVDYINTLTEVRPPVKYLIDGDHFGEIGMLYDCKRTATVRSENYGDLALFK